MRKIDTICTSSPARSRFSYGVRRIGVEEATAVPCPSILIASCEATGPMARVCLSVFRSSITGVALFVLQRLTVGTVLGLLVARHFERGDVLVPSKFWITPWLTKEQREDSDSGSST